MGCGRVGVVSGRVSRGREGEQRTVLVDLRMEFLAFVRCIILCCCQIPIDWPEGVVKEGPLNISYLSHFFYLLVSLFGIFESAVLRFFRLDMYTFCTTSQVYHLLSGGECSVLWALVHRRVSLVLSRKPMIFKQAAFNSSYIFISSSPRHRDSAIKVLIDSGWNLFVE